MNNIMGIDQSLVHTGICIVNDGKIIEAIGIPTNCETHNQIERIAIIADYIYDLCIKHNIKHIYIEGLAFGIKHMTLQLLAGLQYTILYKINHLSIPYQIIAPKSLKKKATGNGNATKLNMLECIDISDQLIIANKSNCAIGSKLMEDIVDAYHLSRYNIYELACS